MPRSYKDFIERISMEIDLDELVRSGEVYNYQTMKEALSEVLRRDNEPTDEQTRLFLEYYDLVDKEIEVEERVRVIPSRKFVTTENLTIVKIKRRGHSYEVIRNKLTGRFVKWIRRVD